MSTAYLPVEEKIQQVARMILDQWSLSGEDKVCIDGEIFFRNFPWLIESELRSILDKLQREGTIDYEWRFKGIPVDPYSGLLIDGRDEDAWKHQFDFVGIECTPNREKLERYLAACNIQRPNALASVADSISTLKQAIPDSTSEGMAFTTYRADVEIFLSNMHEKIGNKLYDELWAILQKIFSRGYTHPDFPPAVEWRGTSRLVRYSIPRSLTSGELKEQRVAGLRGFWGLAERKILAALAQDDDEIELQREHSSLEDEPKIVKGTIADDPVKTVNGLTINMESQKATHPRLGSKDFKAGCVPWTILRICAQEEPDGLGKASLETLKISESGIYKKLKLINKHYLEPIVFYKNGFVYLDPDFKK